MREVREVTHTDVQLGSHSRPARYTRTAGGVLRIGTVTFILADLDDQAQWLRDSAACLIEAAEAVEHLEHARLGGAA